MYVGNVMLLILNLPLIGIWVKVLSIPYRILFPLILLFCLIGIYSINNNTEDIMAMIFFGVLGYLFRKLSFNMAPLILALVLGPIFEYSFCQSLRISEGNVWIFWQRPISATLLTISAVSLLFPLVPYFRKKKFEMEKAVDDD